MVDPAVRVQGATELAHALDRFGDELDDGIRRLGETVAEFIAKDARAAAVSLGSVAGLVAPSVRADGDTVQLGGSGYPMAGGAEFGSTRYPQFQPWRGSGPEGGYFLYPTVRRDSARIDETAAKVVDDAFRKTGL